MGTPTEWVPACWSSARMMYCARSVPCAWINASKDSIHSWVSCASASWRLFVNPLKMW